MPKAGDRFEMIDASVYEVVRTAADTGGQFVEMVFHLPSGCVAPPPHIHSGLVEDYEVLEGSFEVMTDGNWKTLKAGESASVLPETVHTFRNRSGSIVRVRNFHRPGARFDLFIEHMYRLVRARGLGRKNDPRLRIYLSMLILEYPETLAPGRRREQMGLKALAGVGRLLGMRTAI